jgi:hypothetical protein
MPATVLWRCENCSQTKEAGLKPPVGWVELSYWDGGRNKFHRFSFCSYQCASIWAGKRYDEPTGVKNG